MAVFEAHLFHSSLRSLRSLVVWRRCSSPLGRPDLAGIVTTRTSELEHNASSSQASSGALLGRFALRDCARSTRARVARATERANPIVTRERREASVSADNPAKAAWIGPAFPEGSSSSTLAAPQFGICGGELAMWISNDRALCLDDFSGPP